MVHLSNNWCSLLGVVIVTTATVFWFFLLPTLLRGEAANPYAGILVYLVLPTVFIGGLILIPLGILWRRRRERASGTQPTGFLPLTFRNPELRRLVAFIGVTTVANVIIAGQLTYSAVNYMESVSFCGQTCHTVMQPEFTAYQSSPHSRVECVKCHIGPGAGWFVRSKLSGVGQVFAVAFNSYPRPIPTPVHNLRPARETCETCHWPQVFGGNRLKVISKYADDESNTASKTVLLLHIGGGNGTQGIHGMHVGPGIRIRYASIRRKAADHSMGRVPRRQRKSNRPIQRPTPRAPCPVIYPFERWTAWIATTGPATRMKCRTQRSTVRWPQAPFRPPFLSPRRRVWLS